MKKLLFLLTIVLTLFTVVLATETETLLISPAPDAATEAVENVENSAEVAPGATSEDATEKVDDATTESTPVEDDTTTTGPVVDLADSEETTTSGSSSTIVGAILAIVIVVAVIALVALLQKK